MDLEQKHNQFSEHPKSDDATDNLDYRFKQTKEAIREEMP